MASDKISISREELKDIASMKGDLDRTTSNIEKYRQLLAKEEDNKRELEVRLREKLEGVDEDLLVLVQGTGGKTQAAAKTVKSGEVDENVVVALRELWNNTEGDYMELTKDTKEDIADEAGVDVGTVTATIKAVCEPYEKKRGRTTKYVLSE